jgi:hypothetical protein
MGDVPPWAPIHFVDWGIKHPILPGNPPRPRPPPTRPGPTRKRPVRLASQRKNPRNFPAESWHAYQIQYKDSLSDPWSNLGSPIGGNDTRQTVRDPNPAPARFYRVGSF